MTTDHQDRIRQRAHQLWEQEGRPEGRHDEHWKQACTEMGGDELQPGTPAGDDLAPGNQGTIESQLARRQYDELERGAGPGPA